MKKLFLVLIVMAVFTACRKELLPSFSSEISDEVLAQAQNYYKKETSSTSSKSKSTTIKGAPEMETPVRTKLLEPLWDEARESTLSDGTKVLIVPSPDYKISNQQFSALREFVFTLSNGDIVDGKIVEFYGSVEFMEESKESLAQQYKSKVIPGFEGPVIEYDLKYRYLSGIQYEDGKQTDINVGIMVKAKNGPTNATTKSGVNTKTSPGITTKEETCLIYDFYSVSYQSIGGYSYYSYTYIWSFLECYSGAPPGSYQGGGSQTNDCPTCQTYCQVTCGSTYGVTVANGNIAFNSATAGCSLYYMGSTAISWLIGIAGWEAAITLYATGTWSWSQLGYWLTTASVLNDTYDAIYNALTGAGFDACYQDQVDNFNELKDLALDDLDICNGACP
jgi:hypothetical protein